MKNINEIRNSLCESFPEIKSEALNASDKVIEIAHKMMGMNSQELDIFVKHLISISDK